MFDIKWPAALATVFVVLLGGYLLYTQRIVEALRSDAAVLTEIFSKVNEAITTGGPPERQIEVAEQMYFELQEVILGTRVPMVVTVAGPRGDTVLSAENLPFEADPSTPEGQSRIRNYVRRLEARGGEPSDPGRPHVHFGDPPELRRLRWISWLQVAAAVLTVVVGFTVIRSQRRAESERAWTSMARELAHQLGTPISSLQGWLEVMRLPPDERPGDLREGEVATALAEDLERLERISHRFELIGREPELEPLDLTRVVEELQGYLQTRLPRFGPGVRLEVRMPDDLPPVKGNEVLLAWALENVVKNALDALAGRGGKISIEARDTRTGWVALSIRDTGPGVDPEIRDRIFEPGVTTKSGGWGVGLALSRRIVEGVHGGRIELLDGASRGANFQVRLAVSGRAGIAGT